MAKLLRNAGMLHPQADELRDVLVAFLFERGDEVAEIKTVLPAGGKHVVDGAAKSVLAVVVLKRIKEKKTLRADYVLILGLAGRR